MSGERVGEHHVMEHGATWSRNFGGRFVIAATVVVSTMSVLESMKRKGGVRLFLPTPFRLAFCEHEVAELGCCSG